jgi:hypothetical protein
MIRTRRGRIANTASDAAGFVTGQVVSINGGQI